MSDAGADAVVVAVDDDVARAAVVGLLAAAGVDVRPSAQAPPSDGALVVVAGDDVLALVDDHRHRRPVLALLPGAEPGDVVDALGAGAAAVVAGPDVGVAGLAAAVDAVRHGRAHLSPAAAAALLAAWRDRSSPAPASPTPLTAREVEVMAAVATGADDDAVGRRLGISARTVAHHLESVYVKAGVRSRAAASAWWRGQGDGQDRGGDIAPCPETVPRS